MCIRKVTNIMNYSIGQKASFSKTISEVDVYNFAGICGDFNPVHVNKIEAEKSLFGKQVAHGLLVSSFISTVLGMYLPGPGTIYMSQSLKFIAPVYFGDTISVEAEILDISEKRNAKIKTTITNQDGTIVVDGEAYVKLPLL